MKKISILISLLAIMFSCSFPIKKEEKEMDRRAALTEEAINSKERTDSIFMDFRFGMSENEFERHLKQVVRERGGRKNILGLYEIPVKALHGFVFKATLHPEYYKGKLCRLKVRAENVVSGVKNDHIMLFSSVKEAHPEYSIYIDKTLEDYPTYLAFYKNIIIKCYSTGYSYLVYEDAPICIMMDKEQEMEDSTELVNTF